MIFVQSDTLYVRASVSRTQFGRERVFQPGPRTFYSLFMRKNGIKSVHYRLQFFWPGTLFSLAAALKSLLKLALFFSHVYKWALFMNPWGNARFLKGFKRIRHRTQSGARDLCSVFTHSIILRLIWYGWARCIWIAMVFIKMALPKCRRREQLEWWWERLVNCFLSPGVDEWERKGGNRPTDSRGKPGGRGEEPDLKAPIVSQSLSFGLH